MANVSLQAAELARRYIETLEAGQIDACMDLFRDDAVIVFPKSLKPELKVGKEAFRAIMAGAGNVFAAWPKYTLLHQTSEANRSCIEFQGVGKLMNGAEFDNFYCLVFVEEQGRIIELREYVDTQYMISVLQGPRPKEAG